MTTTIQRHNELMCEAIERYLTLWVESDGSLCDEGGVPSPGFEDARCLASGGTLCHWCQLQAAVDGIDYRDLEKAAKA